MSTKIKGISITCFILGILSVLSTFLFLGWIFGIAGLILGIISLCKNYNGKNLSIIGTTLSCSSLFFSVVFILAFWIVYLGDGIDNKSIEVFSSKTKTETNNTETSPVQNEPDTTSNNDYYSTGDTITQNPWRITLQNTSLYDFLPSDYYDLYPQDGNKYLVLFFEIENMSTSKEYFNYFYVNAYLDDYTTNMTTPLTPIDGYNILTGEVGSGKKMRGCLTYEVPDTWEVFELFYNDWYNYSDNQSGFTVKHQDIVSSNRTNTNIEDPENIGSIDVDQGLLNVKLTIPKDYVGEKSQEELDKICKEENYVSITLNDDGSATYVMSKSRHNKLMEEYSNQITNDLNALIGSDQYPNFTNIEANKDFTEFIITTRSTKLDFNESMSTLQLYVYSGLYNIFNGTETDNVTVIFKNAETGEVIHTENSSASE